MLFNQVNYFEKAMESLQKFTDNCDKLDKMGRVPFIKLSKRELDQVKQQVYAEI
jgi:hypothetical protein